MKFQKIPSNGRAHFLVKIFFLSLCVASGCGKSAKDEFVTSNVTTGNLSVSISATGTLEPEEVIDIGAQVAGQIKSFGTDVDGKVVDYGSQVDQGTLLARIDDVVPQTDVNQAKAELSRSNAVLAQSKAKYNQASRNWKRVQELNTSKALARADIDTYQANFEIAEADISVSEALVQQAQAQLEKAQRNLNFCTIVSPVKGVVVDRRVNIGQTVVSSLNTPSLFLIAKDLTKMQVWVAVNEADIGMVKIGQQVRFSVDAFPSEVFEGKVRKVRLNASMNQNVVTYIVEVVTENPEKKLLPYLTANVHFVVEDQKNVLLVPNAALRYQPTAQKGSSGSSEAKPSAKASNQDGSTQGTVWILADGAPKALPVAVHGSDGTMTSINGEGVSEGLTVITREMANQTAAAPAASGGSPFTPQMGRGQRK